MSLTRFEVALRAAGSSHLDRMPRGGTAQLIRGLYCSMTQKQDCSSY